MKRFASSAFLGAWLILNLIPAPALAARPQNWLSSAACKLVSWGSLWRKPLSEKTRYLVFSDNGTGLGKQTVVPGNIAAYVTSQRHWTARNQWNWIQENTVETDFRDGVSYRRNLTPEEKRWGAVKKTLAHYDAELSRLSHKASTISGGYDVFTGLSRQNPQYGQALRAYRKAYEAKDVAALARSSYELFVLQGDYVLQQLDKDGRRLDPADRAWLIQIRPLLKKLTDDYQSPLEAA